MVRNPYEQLSGGSWRRSNFHTHAGTGYRTCGANPAEMVVKLYRDMGYEFLCLSNHDLFVDFDALSDEQILLVPGVEYSQNEHMLTVGVRRSLHHLSHQEAIDAAREEGGFVVLCHPNWQHPEYWSVENMNRLRGYIGIEILNTVIYRMNGSGRATDLWDRLLTGGRLVFGFGHDDFHTLTDAGRSYNLIYTGNRTYEAMHSAVQEGRFCVSSGLKPEYLALEDGRIHVKAGYLFPNFADEFVYRFIGPGGKVLAEQRGSAASAEIGKEEYVRVEAVGENGALLFFQPVWQESAFPALPEEM